MSFLRTVLVDDEHLARRGLSLRLQQIPDVDIVAECANGIEALSAVAEHAPDLLFLDIQMPGMSGLEVVERLQGDNLPMIVFVTAHDEFAVDAFKVHAVDYVLKPLEEERLEIAIGRARERSLQRQVDDEKAQLVKMLMSMNGARSTSVATLAEKVDEWPDKLTIKDGTDILRIPVSEIEWIDAAGDYMCVHTREDTHIMRTTMKQLEALLNPAIFIRVHRSTIVNSQRIAAASPHGNGEYRIQLDNGNWLKASRSCRERIRSILQV